MSIGSRGSGYNRFPLLFFEKVIFRVILPGETFPHKLNVCFCRALMKISLQVTTGVDESTFLHYVEKESRELAVGKRLGSKMHQIKENRGTAMENYSQYQVSREKTKPCIDLLWGLKWNLSFCAQRSLLHLTAGGLPIGLRSNNDDSVRAKEEELEWNNFGLLLVGSFGWDVVAGWRFEEIIRFEDFGLLILLLQWLLLTDGE